MDKKPAQIMTEYKLIILEIDIFLIRLPQNKRRDL